MGLYKNIKCENCDHSFTGGWSRSGTIDNFTNWGPEFLECPMCKHHYKFWDRKPFYKMNIIEKGWTLFVMSFHTLLYGGGIVIMGVAVLFFIGNYFDFDIDDNSVSALNEIFMSLIPIGIVIYGYYYFKDFFEDDKYL
jgi:hypothetical protein